ncbi:MAG: ribonuclease III [Acidimicrobiia bacterium]
MSLEERLGYVFSNPRLLRLALTHRSVSSEDPTRQDNERLEFLGDAVLQLVITDLLYRGWPELPEGHMAKVRASVVSRPTLAEVARELDLGDFLELAPGEEATGGREKDSILADSLEAVIGAVYLDGGIEAAGRLVLRFWEDRVGERAKKPGIKDYKTRLQEALAQSGRRPEYVVEGSGPDHDRRFTAVASVDDRILGRGMGRSKKEAEQAAAREALKTLGVDPR